MRENVDDYVALTHGAANDALTLSQMRFHVFQRRREAFQSVAAQSKERKGDPTRTIVSAITQFAQDGLNRWWHFQSNHDRWRRLAVPLSHVERFKALVPTVEGKESWSGGVGGHFFATFVEAWMETIVQVMAENIQLVTVQSDSDGLVRRATLDVVEENIGRTREARDDIEIINTN